MPDSVKADNIMYYLDATEALDDVNRGEVDFVYGISSRLEAIIQENYFVNLGAGNQRKRQPGHQFCAELSRTAGTAVHPQ